MILSALITKSLGINPTENKLTNLLYGIADFCDKCPKIKKHSEDIRWLSDRIILTNYRIKSIRRRLGLSQSDFGMKINPDLSAGGAQSFVSNLENGNLTFADDTSGTKKYKEIARRIRLLMIESKKIKLSKDRRVNPLMERLINKADPKTGKRLTQVDIARMLKMSKQRVNQLMRREDLGKHLTIVKEILSQYPNHQVKMKV